MYMVTGVCHANKVRIATYRSIDSFVNPYVEMIIHHMSNSTSDIQKPYLCNRTSKWSSLQFRAFIGLVDACLIALNECK